MTCRFCAEPLPADATKCASCGEAHLPAAALRWEHDGVRVLAPGDMPIGVCFGCATVGATRARRVFGRRDAAIQHVDVPTCAACARRADLIPMLGVAILALLVVASVCFLPLLLQRGTVPLLGYATGAFFLMVVVGLALAVYHNARTRVAVRWAEPEVRLRLPDARAVRRAVERDGI